MQKVDRAAQRTCPICHVKVQSNGWQQHANGQKHQSMRFFGRDDRGKNLRPIRLKWPDGSLEREVRPHQVPERLCSIARRAHELVVDSKLLVSHSGVALFNKACVWIHPEAICYYLLRLKERESSLSQGLVPIAPSADFSYRHPGTVAAIAALVEANRAGTEREGGLTKLELSTSEGQVVGGDAEHEAALGAALTALASALPNMRDGGQRVRLDISNHLTQRRHVMLFVKAMERSLQASTGISEVRLSAAEGVLHADDVLRLASASTAGWRAREWAVLLGTHNGGESPLKLLKTDLLRYILDLAAASSRVHVIINGVAATKPAAPVAQPGPMHAAVPPPTPLPPPPRAVHHGADLGFIAGLI